MLGFSKFDLLMMVYLMPYESLLNILSAKSQSYPVPSILMEGQIKTVILPSSKSGVPKDIETRRKLNVVGKFNKT
jgi:hypothetical protein